MALMGRLHTHRIPKRSRWKSLVVRLIGQPDLLTRLHLGDIFAALRLEPHHTVLDIGCGNGFLSYLMAKQARMTYGLDIADVERTNPVPPDLAGRLAFVTASGENTPLDDASTDVVLLAEVAATIDEPRRFLKEISRVLAPGGRVVIVNGGDKRAIRNAYGRNSLLIRAMRRVSRRTPPHYDAYLAELLRSFGNALTWLPDEEFFRELLADSGFDVLEVSYTPSAAAQGIYERIQFVLHCLGRRTYGPHHFVLYPLLKAVDVVARRRGTGLIIVGRRRDAAAGPDPAQG